MNTMIDYKNEKNQFSGLLRTPLLNKIQYNVKFHEISSEEEEESDEDLGGKKRKQPIERSKTKMMIDLEE